MSQVSVYRTIGPLVVILPDAGAILTSAEFLLKKNVSKDIHSRKKSKLIIFLQVKCIEPKHFGHNYFISEPIFNFFAALFMTLWCWKS